MTIEYLRQMGLEKELSYTASRSSGPGGQNVNKVNSKVELRFNIGASSVLSQSQKEIIRSRLTNRISAGDDLIIISQSGRSQIENRIIAVERFFILLAKALTPVKKRIATSPSKGSNEKRLKRKKIQSAVKKIRRDRGLPDME